MPDREQAAYLELALRALEGGDRPALAGALVCLDTATLDHLAAVITHPVWAALADHYPPVLSALPVTRP